MIVGCGLLSLLSHFLQQFSFSYCSLDSSANLNSFVDTETADILWELLGYFFCFFRFCFCFLRMCFDQYVISRVSESSSIPHSLMNVKSCCCFLVADCMQLSHTFDAPYTIFLSHMTHKIILHKCLKMMP